MFLSGVTALVSALTLASGLLSAASAPSDPTARSAAGPQDDSLAVTRVVAASSSTRPAESAAGTPLPARAAELLARESGVSRGQERTSPHPGRADRVRPGSGGQQRAARDVAHGDPRELARAMMPEFGFSASEFGCLDRLWVSESDWDPRADNPTSSAYGIPQALTGGTHDLPADYRTDPAAQVRWGLGYIRDSYGSPCSAWEFKQGHRWY